jgi:O-antigen/teichoic acid export membrane protein
MKDRNRTARGESRLLPNVFALVLQTVVGTLLTLVQVKILSNYLAVDTFGLFASLGGFSLLLSVLAANCLPQLLARYLPVYEASGQRTRALRLSVGCLVISTGLLILLVLAAYGLRGWLLAYVDQGLVTGEVLLWFSITTLGITLKQVIYGGLQGLRRMTVQTPLELVSLLATLVWVVLVRDDLSLLVLFRILGTVHVASLGIGIPVLLWHANRVGVVSLHHDENVARMAVSGYRAYVLGAIGISLVALAFTDVDRYIIAQVLPLELIALFHIVARITQSASRLLAASSTAMQPELTRLYAGQRTADIDTVTRTFLKLNVGAGVLTAFAISILSRDLIVLVSSDAYTPAIPLLLFLASCIPLKTATAPLTTVMKATDQVGGAFRVDLVWALVYVVLIAVLSPWLQLTGVGLASLVACVIQLVAAIKISRLSVDVGSVGFIVGKSLLAAFIAMIPVLFVVVLPDVGSSGLSVFVKVLLLLVGCVLYLRLSKWMGVLDHDERERLLLLLRARGLTVLARLV